MNENTPTPERRVRQGMDYGETEDVQQVHAAIQREKREPHARSRAALALVDRDLRTCHLFWRRVPRALFRKFQRRWS